MEFAGELSTIGLPEVFDNIAFNQLSGVLTVTERESSYLLYFHQGQLRALCPPPERPFDYAAIAEATGAATPERIDQARARRRRRSLRAALKETGGFDVEAFDAGMLDAIEDELMELFGLEQAAFVFEEDRPGPGVFDEEQLEAGFSVDPANFAHGAARRRGEWQEISRYVGADTGYFLAVGDEQPPDLSPEAAAVWVLLDGTRNLRDVTAQLPHGRFQVLRAVAQLVELGHAAPASLEQLRDLAHDAQQAREINRAAQLLVAALEVSGGDPEVRWQLILLYEAAGRTSEAAAEYNRLARSHADRGDVAGALDAYERAAELTPYDIETLREIASIHDARGDARAFRRAQQSIAGALSAYGRHDEALAVYRSLVAQDPEADDLHEAIAASFVKVREPRNAVAEALGLAQKALAENRIQRALRYFRTARSIDANCAVANARIREIESGHLFRKRRTRRRRIAYAVGACVVGLTILQAVREHMAHEALHHAARASVTSLAQEPPERTLITAIEHYARICSDYPLTRGAGHARDMVQALLLEELQRVEALVPSDPGDAENCLRRLGRVRLPDELKSFWRDSRDDVLRRIGESRAATGAKAR